jgi:hypothetical protein
MLLNRKGSYLYFIGFIILTGGRNLRNTVGEILVYMSHDF